MKNIDLAMDYGDVPQPISPANSERQKHYPTFHYEGADELGIPASGTMTVRYKEVSNTKSTRDGRKHYACTIEVQEIISAKGERDERPAKVDKATEEALDGLMRKRMGKEKSEDY